MQRIIYTVNRSMSYSFFGIPDPQSTYNYNTYCNIKQPYAYITPDLYQPSFWKVPFYNQKLATYNNKVIIPQSSNIIIQKRYYTATTYETLIRQMQDELEAYKKKCEKYEDEICDLKEELKKKTKTIDLNYISKNYKDTSQYDVFLL